MDEKLSTIEQDFIDIAGKGSLLTSLGLHVESLVAEMRRARQDQSIVMRVGMARHVAEEVEQAKTYLEDLSQKLAALDREHAEKLVVTVRDM